MNDEAWGDLAHALDLLQTVRPQGRTRLHDVEDEVGEPDERRELDRARELENLGAPRLTIEVALGGARVLRGELHLCAGARETPTRAPDERQSTAAAGELERHEQITVDLVEYVATDDAAVDDTASDIERQVAVLEQQDLAAELREGVP